MDDHLSILQASYQQAIDSVGEDVLAQQFFDYFFDTYPETLLYFKGTDTAYFGAKKLKIIYQFLLDIIKHPDFAEGQITQEVIRHQMYGLQDREYYCCLIDALQLCVRSANTQGWPDSYETAWNDITIVFKGYIGAAVDDFV